MSSETIDVILVDDEKMVRNSLEIMILKYCQHVRVISKCGSVQELISALELYTPHVILLDIRMPQFSGIDFLRMNNREIEVIFVTAFRGYALDAIKGQAFDYILKPVRIDELVQTFEKLRAKLSRHSFEKPQRDNSSEIVCINYSKGRKLVSAINIVHIDSESNYSRYFFADGTKMLVAKTLLQLEKELPNNIFYRCHHSHIVNMRWIKSIERRNRDSYLYLRNNKELKVSRRKRKEILSMVESLRWN